AHMSHRAGPLYVLSLPYSHRNPRDLLSFPTRRSSDLAVRVASRAAATASSSAADQREKTPWWGWRPRPTRSATAIPSGVSGDWRSEEHTSELQSREKLVCRLLLEKKKLQTATRLQSVA